MFAVVLLRKDVVSVWLKGEKALNFLYCAAELTVYGPSSLQPSISRS